jgi:pyruvate/2-oxoglutarate dehydrogenase complex dihydrolipoamide acyltransferase (E2) component
MAEIVKSRLVHYYVPGKDLITGAELNTERMATHGQRLHTEDGVDTDTDRYNVPQAWLDKLRRDGHLFSEAEQAAALGGVSDDYTVHETLGDEVRGDTRTSPSTSVLDPDGSAVSSLGGGEGFHPLTFGEMSVWQVEEYLRQSPDVNDLVDAFENETTAEAREALANKFLTAATNLGEGHEDLVEALSTGLGFAATGPGPNDEGVAGTEPGGDLTGGSGATGGDDGGSSGGEGGSGSEEDSFASDAAREAAKEHGLSEDEIDGTGSEGKITKADVEKAAKEKESR